MSGRRGLAIVVVSLLLAACNGEGPGGQVGNSNFAGSGASQGPTTSSAPSDGPSAGPTAPTFAPINLAGTGDKVPKFTIPADAPAIALISAKGVGNFSVESLAADGSQNELLVNTIGAYSGTVLFDIGTGEHSVAFKVGATGIWSIVVKPITSARTWDTSTKLTGKGDDVVLLSPPAEGLTSISVTGSGKDNLIIQTYGLDGMSTILVNEIGPYSGVVQLPDQAELLEVNADGAWSVDEQ
jgi:hypothetical protein